MTTPITDPEYRQTVHATAVAIGKTCVLLRGRSGSGKSSLAFALIDRVRIGDGFAAFVADDRVELCVDRGRLIARAPEKIAGLADKCLAGAATRSEKENLAKLLNKAHETSMDLDASQKNELRRLADHCSQIDYKKIQQACKKILRDVNPA